MVINLDIINGGIYYAMLQKDLNKYKPGIAPFTICGIMPNGNTLTTPTVTTINNSKSGIISDSSNLGIDKLQVSNTVNIIVPKESIIYYEKKIIPKGTIFLITFIQADSSKPVIIGRDIYGYYK